VTGALLWLLVGCGEAPPEGPSVERSFALLYSGNLDGETEPCG
jgi:hypothetical protein